MTGVPRGGQGGVPADLLLDGLVVLATELVISAGEGVNGTKLVERDEDGRVRTQSADQGRLGTPFRFDSEFDCLVLNQISSHSMFVD